MLVFTLLFASVQPLAVVAASPDEDDITSSVTYGDGVIEENVTVNFEGKIITVYRVTTDENISTTTITEDGETTTFTQEMSYEGLLSSLQGSNQPMTRSDRVPGYTYKYLTKKTQTSYFGPEYSTWSNIYSLVSTILQPISPAASLISDIVSKILNSSASVVEGKFLIVRNWYEVYDDTGTFLGYYRCEYTVETLVKNSSGSYISISYKSGSMESFYVF